MRLLRLKDDGSIGLTEYYKSENDLPRYAALSHTWGLDQDEVTYDDMINGRGKEKKGYKKFEIFANQASKDGLSHFWIDSACIDKSSSSELSEAINSMFRWYGRATTCYAYLADVSSEQTAQTCHDWKTQFRASKWHTRGWTLQELLAPHEVKFYDRNGVHLGDRTSLTSLITAATNIPSDVLNGRSLQRSSIAQRMSWAARRETSRSEDKAYCLLGLFDVCMPLLYGEGGERAFLRLQEEIMKRSEDQSIFAWRMDRRHGTHGLLAPSPAAFVDSAHIVPIPTRRRPAPFAMTSRGLQVQLPMAGSSQSAVRTVALDCQDQRTSQRIGLQLLPIGENRFLRTRLDQFLNPRSIAIARRFGPFDDRLFYAPQHSFHPLKSMRRYPVPVINMMRSDRIRLPPLKPRPPGWDPQSPCTRCMRCPFGQRSLHTGRILRQFSPVR